MSVGNAGHNKTRVKKKIKGVLKLVDKTALIKKCVEYLRERKGNRRLQKDILRYYNLDDRGSKLKIPQKGIDRAKHLLASFNASVTGAQPGDVLEGTSQLTRNAVITLHVDQDNKNNHGSKNVEYESNTLDEILLHVGKEDMKYHSNINGFVYPESRNLNSIRQHPTIWNQYLKKLGSLKFYQDMSIKDREIWLYVNEEISHNSYVLGDNNLVQILQIGRTNDLLDEESINILMEGDGWSSEELESFFPSKPGSTAEHNTLYLIRSFWRINVAYEITDKYTGSSKNVISIPFGAKIKNPVYYIIKDVQNMENVRGKNDGTLAIATYPIKHDPDPLDVDMWLKKSLKKRFKSLPPSFYKSLIQKIIRFHPKVIKFPSYMKLKSQDSLKVLKACVILLAEEPGSFVPDIQRYVTGKESCFKRLAVSIMEDGYTKPEYIASLLSAAHLCQRVKSWRPGNEIYELALKSCYDTMKSTKYFNYSIRAGSKRESHSITHKQNALERASATLDEIKSFKTDIHMFRDAVDNGTKTGYDTRPKYMDLEQAVDHHWATGVTYFMDYQTISDMCSKNSSTTFQPFFNKLWDVSSGFNVRKKEFQESFHKKDIIKKIRKAQNLYLLVYHGEKNMRSVIPNKYYEINVSLNDGWLAALIGTLDVGLRPPSIVTINPENLQKFIAIRRPSRDRNELLTEDQKARAIEKAIGILKKGVTLKNAMSPISILQSAKAKVVVEGETGKMVYMISYKNEKGKTVTVNWDKIKKGVESFPVHPKMKIEGKEDFGTIITNIGGRDGGVEEDHLNSFQDLLRSTSRKILRRVIYYLSGFGSMINMNRIGRDGGGIVQSVVAEDVGAYQFLLRTSKIYCGAMEPRKGGQCGFYVRSILLVEEIKEQLQKYFSNKEKRQKSKNKNNLWAKIRDKKKRKLWDHQKFIVKELHKKSVSGTRGAFIWLRVGMGKTLIVLKHIQKLIKEKRMPKYILYTLPDSSITSVKYEIEQFGLPINVITNKKTKMEPYTVNMVTSDHKLRICESSFVSKASETFFIVDEVHKAMNDTQRTTVATNIASLSYDFVVMTGTPVIDSKTYKLISWLKMIVPYEVNDKNYLVAANSMLTKNVETGVKVLRKNVEAKFSGKQLDLYNGLVPLALGGRNTNSSKEQMKEAANMCYKACDTEMVKLVKKHLNERKNNGVMLVAKDAKHQKKLQNMLVRKGIREKDIYVLESGKSIVLTDETVKTTGIDYQVVITTIRQAEGYTLTRLNMIIRSVYPSNQANRTQIEGRINRIGQRSEIITYVVVHTGILTNIMNNHNDAKSLEIALVNMAKMSKEIK